MKRLKRVVVLLLIGLSLAFLTIGGVAREEPSYVSTGGRGFSSYGYTMLSTAMGMLGDYFSQ